MTCPGLIEAQARARDLLLHAESFVRSPSGNHHKWVTAHRLTQHGLIPFVDNFETLKEVLAEQLGLLKGTLTFSDSTVDATVSIRWAEDL